VADAGRCGAFRADTLQSAVRATRLQSRECVAVRFERPAGGTSRARDRRLLRWLAETARSNAGYTRRHALKLLADRSRQATADQCFRRARPRRAHLKHRTPVLHHDADSDAVRT